MKLIKKHVLRPLIMGISCPILPIAPMLIYFLTIGLGGVEADLNTLTAKGFLLVPTMFIVATIIFFYVRDKWDYEID